MPSLFVLTGPASCGKTARLLERYRAILATTPPESTLWLAPTSRSAVEIRDCLLGGELDSCFSPGVTTFARFAETVLQRGDGPRPQPTPLSEGDGTSIATMRRLSGLLKRQLVRQLIDEAARKGALRHFGPIASTAGLLDLVCDFIGQMKRLEIWPEQFAEACSQRGFSAKDRELLEIYSGYQDRLLAHDLYDAEGCFWSARDLLHRRPMPFQLVIADGFADFTRTEHDILEDLAAHAVEMWITLPTECGGVPRSDMRPANATPVRRARREGAGQRTFDWDAAGEQKGERGEWRGETIGPTRCAPSGGRGELFQKPQNTMAELHRRHAHLRVEAMGPAATVWPAMAHIERTIFSNPRTMTPAPSTAGVEILAGGRQIGEIELIGRRIKRLLLEGALSLPFAPFPSPVRPGEIAVVFRRPEPLAELISEVFGRLQIPCYLESGRSLDRCPAIVMLLRLLELDGDDWPMHKLLGVLGNNYFAPDWADWNVRAAGAAERAIRRLQIPRGREKLLEQLKGVAGFSRNPGEVPAEAGITSAGTTSAVHNLLRGLAEALDQLPRQDTLAAHARAWTNLAQRTGILRSIRDDADLTAWRQLHDALRESERMAAQLGQEAARVDRRQAREALLDMLQNQETGLSSDDWGRVRVLSASAARHLRIPYLFLAGLSEKSFPAADADGALYSEAEYQRLIEAGLPLPSRSDRQADEMLLFYQTVTAATRRLWLSYPSVDDSGEPLTPSPYLKEIQQACGEGSVPVFEQIDLSPVPSKDDIFSLEAFRIRAVAEAMEGKVELLAESAASTPPLIRGLEFSLLRQDRERFGAAEGMLGETAAARIEADLPVQRIFSATELERYAYCPFRHFLEKVLKVEPLEEVDLEIDYLQRGESAHGLLAELHRRVNEAAGGPASPVTLTPADYQRLLAETAAEVLVQPGHDSLADAFLEIDRRILLKWLEEYRQQHEKYDAQGEPCDRPPRPAFFEISFGRPLRDGDGPPSTDQPLELISHGQTVRLAGRIDRIDVGEIGGRVIFNILDYKTGKGTRFSLEACQRGTVLQLPVYALAAAELILKDRQALPWQAGYWYISEGGFKPKQALRMNEREAGRICPTETWEAVRGKLAETIVGLINAMRRGQFPVWSDDSKCTGLCPYKTICRINHIRSLEKTWRPPAVEGAATK